MRPARVPRLWPAVVAAGLLAFLAAAAGIAVPASHGARTTADEPQYLLTAISLASDRDLDIADELAAGRWRAFHAPPLPEQTEPLASGRRLSPHDPLLPLLLAVPVAAGGWVGAKLVMAALAGVLAGLLLWTAVRRFGVPVGVGLPVVAVFALSPPLAVYGAQVYPEFPAALAVVAAVAALTAPAVAGRGGAPGPAAAPAPAGAPASAPRGREAPGRAAAPAPAAVAVVGVAVVALPWLAVKYVPVAATLALLALWRLLGAGARRRALALAAGLAAAGVAFVVLHRWWYGGWTPYATGHHFVGGELTAVGSDPDHLGRSRRLLGLAIDRDFGLAAWQPAFLLAVPALATLARRRPAGWAALVLPLAAGWLVATFLALTMHGWWFPGRQVVVVLPLAVLAVACWAGGSRRRRLAVAVAGGVGVVAYAWLLADGLAGRVTWAVDFFATGYPAYRAWRLVLPDYLTVTTATWVLHAAWLAAVAAWAAAAWRRAGSATATATGARARPATGAAAGAAGTDTAAAATGTAAATTTSGASGSTGTEPREAPTGTAEASSTTAGGRRAGWTTPAPPA